MATSATSIERYLELFQNAPHARERSGANAPWLANLREAAIAQFEAQGFPSTKHEEWRFTNVSPIANLHGELAVPASGPLPGLAQYYLDVPSHRLVFVNGHYRADLSAVLPLPAGAFVGSLHDAIAANHEAVQAHLGSYADAGANPFTALNTALQQDGAFIYVPEGIELAEPIQLLFATTSGEAPTLAFPRNLIVAAPNSSATVTETYLGPTGDIYFNNPVTEVVTQTHARVDHYKLQLESPQGYHVATTQIQQGRGCRFNSINANFGARLARNDINAVMAASGIETTLNGLFFISDHQHVDNHTVMDHAQPLCASHEFYAGILDGNAHGVFNGKIFVRPDAQKTDAKQTNRNLLLSRHAVIDTKPQLEILADDVKCTHGATVGQLNEDALFYLRARGIAKTDARDMLVFAFANNVLDGIKIEPLRLRMERELIERMARSRAAAGNA